MIKDAVATGENVEVAFARACKELGVETIDAECEILEMPQKKTFGLFGGRPAKVRAYIQVPDPVKPAPAVPSAPVARPEPPKPAAPAPAAPAASPAAPAPRVSPAPMAAPASVPVDGDPAENAAAYLKTVLAGMGLPDAEVEIHRCEGGASLTLSGGDTGFVIGHRGETLDALQYLTSLVANHSDGTYYRLTLDVGNYREKRKETLEALGRKMAYRAVRTGRNSSLEPMNPYERRIIHTAVQTVEGAKSWSEGEDQGRHVVIGPENGERYQPRRDSRRPGGRGGYRGSGSRGFDKERRSGGKPPRSSSQRGAPQSRPSGPKADDPGAPIYGKIEVNK